MPQTMSQTPLPQATFFGLITGIIVLAGILGGLVNYFSTRKDDPKESSFRKSAVLGITAALLVPLFLNMISSNLLDSIRGDTSKAPDLSKVLVFLGFCLVAAISSTAFIKTLTDRVLKEAKEAKEVARQAEKTAAATQSAFQPILEKETESDASATMDVAITSDEQVVNPNERKILESLAKGKSFRTRQGLAKETGIARSDVVQMMDDLKARELVTDKWIVITPGQEPKRRWSITNKGRESIAA
jgi:LytS/YehU family sensor histidine kinase